MAVERHGAKRSKASKAHSKKSAKSAKKTGAKKSAKRASHGAVAVSKIATRKPVPFKKARVGKRAVLPPLPPPPTVLLKATRSPMRRASRVKALLRNKGAVKASPAVSGVAQCTEAALREKLRVAAPYVELWLSRGDGEPSDAPSPEAAFVRIWQWLTLETMLDDRRTINGDLIRALFVEEVGRL
ncbi:MAG: hypothetical protein ACRECE_08880 [Xanthobacteraceae bacterium]